MASFKAGLVVQNLPGPGGTFLGEAKASAHLSWLLGSPPEAQTPQPQAPGQVPAGARRAERLPPRPGWQAPRGAGSRAGPQGFVPPAPGCALGAEHPN